MNKVVTVNLNGNAYQLEESAYATLDGYLSDAEAKLKSDPGLTEIMADLEQAIADKCNARLTPAKNVITKAEIDQILKEMGPVEPEAGEGAQDQDHGQTHAAAGARSSAGAGAGAPKRLYRIREGSMIAGVCKGLAVYFNVDVTPIRLGVALLAIISVGVLALGYFLAMIIIPQADTSEERAEAHGQPFNAQEIVGNAKKHYSKFKQEAGEWWTKTGSTDWKNLKHNVRQETDRAAHQARSAVRNMRRSCTLPPQLDYVSHVVGMVFLPIFGIITAALTVVWILAVISLVNTGAVFGWPLPVAIPLWVGILMLLALYGAVVSPFRMVFYGRGYLRGGRYYVWPSVFGGLVWLGCIVVGGVVLYNHVPEVRDAMFNLQLMVTHLIGR